MKNNKGHLALRKYWSIHGWKPKEIETLKKFYKKITDKQMVIKLKHRHSKKAISAKRLELGLKKGKKTRQGIIQSHQIWTPEEVEILLSVWKDYNQREISEQFIPSKTPVQINHKKMQMGLKKPPVWTNEQRALLLDNGADYTQTELQKKFFPDKTRSQISDMRKHFGIKRNLPQLWTEKDLDILKKYGSIWPDKDIQYEFLPDKSLKQIHSKRRNLNIKKNYYKQGLK